MLGITGVTVPPSSCMSRKNYVAGTHFVQEKRHMRSTEPKILERNEGAGFL